MLRTISLAAAALVAAAAAAAAHDRSMGAGPHGIDFAAIDTDSNGSLSRAELQARAVARIAAADANGDGVLDRAEIVAMFPAPPDAMFDVFAANPAEGMADRLLALVGATEAGQVEVTTLADRRVNRLLAAADEDRDAAVSQAEADAFADSGARWRHHARPDGHGGMDDHAGERQGGDAGAPEAPEPPRE